LHRSLYDTNNVLLVDGISRLSTYDTFSNLGFSKTFPHNLSFAVLKIAISASNKSFDSADFTIKFKDDGSTQWGNYQTITKDSVATYFSSTKYSGWMEFTYDFMEKGLSLYPSMSYTSFNPSIIISSSTRKYLCV
jgi:hypothetical protein